MVINRELRMFFSVVFYYFLDNDTKIEMNKTIQFLDTKINHENRDLEFERYFKKTNTGIFTPSCSYAPSRYKTVAMRDPFYLAIRILSDHLYDKVADQIVFRK